MPIIDKIEENLSPFVKSLKDFEKIIYPKKKKKSIRTEVNLASQTHQVPHIGFPQADPVTKQIAVNVNPIGAAAFERQNAVTCPYTKPKKLFTAKNTYIIILSQADGTCIYIILTAFPC